jgi:hypothetical protein
LTAEKNEHTEGTFHCAELFGLNSMNFKGNPQQKNVFSLSVQHQGAELSVESRKERTPVSSQEWRFRRSQLIRSIG